MTILVWLAPLLVPLAAAGVTALRPGGRRSWLLVAAPLPALVLAVLGPVTPAPELGWLLLGTSLQLDPLGRVLLVLTGVVWVAAGAVARHDEGTRRSTATWWLLSLAGNVAVVLAADVLSFYAGFVLLTLAAYGLIVHHRTPRTLRAGRITLVLGVAGETVLLGGLLLAAVGADGLLLSELAAATATSAYRSVIVAALVVGFGIKAGLIGLHVWLPLAHPAAPFAASAVLSGAMIKAGLIGWLRLLPVGELALPGWSTLLAGLGVAGALVGVVIGLTQTSPKVLLAYSSVSQMGFVVLLVGAALASPATAPLATAAAAAYALHHGLAKAALFLGVGLLPRAVARWQRTVLLGGMVLAGLALAGAPLTSGAAAKAWMKQALEATVLGVWAVPLTTVAAVGTTLLMARLLVLLRAQPPATASTPVSTGPWLALLAAVAGTTVLLPVQVLDVLALPGWQALVLDPIAPLVVGAAIAVVTAWLAARSERRPPTIPAGDVVVVGERAVAALGTAVTTAATPVRDIANRTATSLRDQVLALGRHDEGLDRLEAGLTRWSTGGAMVALVAIALVLVLLPPPS